MSEKKIVITEEYKEQSILRQKYWKEIRSAFMYKDSHCHWCGVEVIYFLIEDGAHAPDNYATIDHLYDKMGSRHYRIYPNYEDLVLACFRCNQKRSQERHKPMSREERRARSQLGTKRKPYTPRVNHLGVLD